MKISCEIDIIRGYYPAVPALWTGSYRDLLNFGGYAYVLSQAKHL
jgi:hypothetical protein